MKKINREFGLISIAFLILLLLVGCTKEVSVDSGEYGVLVRYGEVVGHVKGPGDGEYKIRYKVIDPEKFLVMTGSQKGGFEMLLEREIANQAMQGKDVSTEDSILKIIENMKLPIVIMK